VKLLWFQKISRFTFEFPLFESFWKKVNFFNQIDWFIIVGKAAFGIT